jgi:hypothetical protein
MGTKKWFGIAAVVAAIGGAVGYALTKVKESPETAADMYEGVKETAKESPEKAAAVYDAAKEKLKRGNGDNEEADAEMETAGS